MHRMICPRFHFVHMILTTADRVRQHLGWLVAGFLPSQIKSLIAYLRLAFDFNQLEHVVLPFNDAFSTERNPCAACILHCRAFTMLCTALYSWMQFLALFQGVVQCNYHVLPFLTVCSIGLRDSWFCMFLVCFWTSGNCQNKEKRCCHH